MRPFFCQKGPLPKGGTRSQMLIKQPQLASLRELTLDRNRLKKIDPGAFDGLPNLRELRIEDNGLRTFAGFSSLTRLQILYAGTNRVADTNELENLAPLTCLLECVLAGNPLCRKQLYRPLFIRKMMQLRFLDRQEITADERERAIALFSTEEGGPRSSLIYYADPQAERQHENRVPVKLTSVNFDTLAQLGSVGGGATQITQQQQQQQQQYVQMYSMPQQSGFSERGSGIERAGGAYSIHTHQVDSVAPGMYSVGGGGGVSGAYSYGGAGHVINARDARTNQVYVQAAGRQQRPLARNWPL